jgi:predicted ATPase/class 3 adenylate cyclase
MHGDGVRSCCVAAGYSECSVSVKAVSTAAPVLRHFRFRRDCVAKVENRATRTAQRPYVPSTKECDIVFKVCVGRTETVVAAMQQIADWLNTLGLGQYAQRFAENDVDISVLRDLTDQHLKDLGVSLGHRLKILRAIRELADAAPAAPPSAIASKPAPHDSAERRQLTVMFCDLVGSTALSAQLDPEELREIIGAYHRRCAEVITTSGGFVAKYLGDGVLAYFGYPEAHEDDAEQAVRAGLALVDAVAKLDAGGGSALRVRIGIATGVVVVGGLLGEGAAQEQAVVGETPNLAARLQTLAEPDTVVIDQNTRRLLGGLFDYRDLGTVSVKGFGAPVQVWQVTGASAVESRFEALRTATTPLVGREEEIEILLRRWAQAKAGDGAVVLISGEPGIGKSRIIQTLQDRLRDEPHTRLRTFCSPHHQDSALYPTITQLERAAGFRREDTAEQRLDKLVAVLAQATGDLREAVPLLADLLSIPTSDRYPPLDLTPQKRKEKTLQALLTQLDGLAAREPVLTVFEDVHWIDPTSLELLDLIVDRVPTPPVLLIITFRPEFAPRWIGRPHVTLLTLSRLPPAQRAEMIAGVTGGKALPHEIADQIVERTDGVPLFIEELTKTVVESGILIEAGDRYAVTGLVARVAIPTTLQASLLARLDRLPATREVAQIGAALGRSFSHELITAVAQMPQKQIDDALAQLVSAELIFRRGAPPDAEYTFKHALVQDAAYKSLLKSRRQALHARIAQSLEERFPDTARVHPELVAYHYSEAGAIKPAIRYLRMAGKRAAERSANAEAVEQFSGALRLLEGLPDSPERTRSELDLLTAMGPALIAAKGYGASEIERSYARARELCQQLADEEGPLLFSVLQGLWGFYNIRTDFQTALELGRQCLNLGQSSQDPALQIEGYRLVGGTLFYKGDFASARDHAERGITLYSHEQHRSLAFRYGQDPMVGCLSYAASALRILGYQDQAITRSQQALALAQELSHPYTLGYSLIHATVLSELCGDSQVTQARATALVKLSRDQGFPFLLAGGHIHCGAALVAQGQSDTGIGQILEGLAIWQSTGAELWRPYFLAMLARAYGQAGKADEGLATLSEALTVVTRTGEHWFEPELNRLKGEMLLARSETGLPEAEECFSRALSLAHQQGARLWELRAATSLSRLWCSRGERTKARELLAPIYGDVAEGLGTLDLREAKALLDE